MLSLLKDNVYSITLDLLFLLFLLSLFFPVEKYVPKFLKIDMIKSVVLLVILLIVSLVIIKATALGFFISLLLITFSFFVFLFGMLSDRKYIYTLALIALVLTPIMLATKLDNLAESLSQMCYFLLVLGVLKDIFNDKIFE
jgi:hypothetical protein